MTGVHKLVLGLASCKPVLILKGEEASSSLAPPSLQEYACHFTLAAPHLHFRTWKRVLAQPFHFCGPAKLEPWSAEAVKS